MSDRTDPHAPDASPPPAPAPPAPTSPTDDFDYDATREVRFAIVLFGGVSLAIYMNGIVQELLHLVRATAPSRTDPGALHVPDAALTPVERVYRALGCQLQDGVLTAPAGVDAGPVSTRFVVDIVTGTSAGGINGVFLAKALATDRSLDGLTKLWVEQGDLALLVNDRKAYRGLGFGPKDPPQSLLAGPRMYSKLLYALNLVSDSTAAPPGPSPYADAIDLWVTATDLHGRVEVLPTADRHAAGDIQEVNHRVTFHFAYGVEASTGGDLNQFVAPYDPMLAFAARCTSSFPAAFQPMRLIDARDAITALNDGRHDWYALDDPITARFFQGRSSAPDDYLLYSYADGGYLDNMPVDLVMNSLPHRRSALPVDRLVLFVDPDPGTDSVPAESTDPVDLVQTLLDVVTLPRQETIGADIERILGFGQLGAARRDVYDAIDRALQHVLDTRGSVPPPSDRVTAMAVRPAAAVGPGDDAAPSVAELADQATQRMRGHRVADELGQILARVVYPGRVYDADTDAARGFATLLSEYEYPDPSREPPYPPGMDPAAFLAAFDATFVFRRINFVEGRIGQRLRALPRPLSAADLDLFHRLVAVRRDLDVIYARLRSAVRNLRAPGASNPAAGPLAAFSALVGSTPLTGAALVALLRSTPGLGPALQAVLDAFAQAVQLAAFTADAEAALGDDVWVRIWWDWFPAYDEATLAVQEALPGENDAIRVIRVSPRDANRIRAYDPEKPKLAGSGIHHFGGFFSAGWRRNDILWGRLDGAERLIATVVGSGAAVDPDAAARRDALIDAAHRAIIAETLVDPDYRTMLAALVGTPFASPPNDNDVTTVMQWLASSGFHVPPGPDRADLVALGTRSARVARRMGDGLAEAHPQIASPVAWAGRAVSFVASLAELAMPGSVKNLFGRQLLNITLIAGVLLVAAGAIGGVSGVVGVGWLVIGASIGVRIVIDVLTSWISSRKGWIIVLGAVGLVAVALAVRAVMGLSEGAPQAIGAGLLGAALGVGVVALAGFAAGGPRARQARRVALVLLPLLVLPLAALGFTHLREDVRSAADHLPDWAQTTVERTVP